MLPGRRPPLILPVMVTDISVAPETMSPPLTLPVVVEEGSIALAAGWIELVPSARSSSLPPPPGFSPFVFPLDEGGLDVDELCARVGIHCLASLSPIGRVSSDVPDLAMSPEVGVLVSRIVDGSSDVAPAVGYTGAPLPSVNSTCGQTMLWAPEATPGHDADRCSGDTGASVAVGSGGSIHSLRAGCAFRHTTYRASDYASPVGDYGLPLHHPRFIEWIGVPQSAGLMELSGARWVDKLSREQAVAAAVHLQRDVGLMQTNVDVLDQYALSPRLIEICLGSRGFPVEDVAAGAPGPRVRRAAVQMEAMGLWHPPVMMAYRSSVHESTGFSPYRLMFGEECTLPMDIGLPSQDPDPQEGVTSPYAAWVKDSLEVAFDQVRRSSGQAVQRQKRLYDQRAV